MSVCSRRWWHVCDVHVQMRSVSVLKTTLPTNRNFGMDQGIDKIYLDYNATTPIDDEVICIINKVLRDAWGNPSSSYPAGVEAKQVITQARKEVADAINAKPSEIIFTSGGTEANNWVIYSAIERFRVRNLTNQHKGEGILKPHVVTSTVEHDSISAPLVHLQEQNIIDVTFVPVDKKFGYVTADDIESAVQSNTCLVTVMMANNETGTIMPIAEMCQRLLKMDQDKRPLFHTDAAQALGKIPVDVSELNIDYLTLVGHKFYGPRIGALYVKNLGQCGPPLHPLLRGGAQERSYRAGTENTPMIAGLGKAAFIASTNLELVSAKMSRTRDYLEKKLLEKFGLGNVIFNCFAARRLPNTSSVSFPGENLEGYKLLQKITGFCCSTGSACHSDSCKPSQILLNFHVPFDVAANTIRLSTGKNTTITDIDNVVEELKMAVQESQGNL